MPMRKCVVSRAVRDNAQLIRFVLGPDNRVWPDVAEKAPGRGVWVTADAATVSAAVKRKSFAAGFKSAVIVPDDLVVQVEAQLRKNSLHLLGLAKRAGHLMVGEDAVRDRLRMAEPGVVLCAADGATRSMGKTFGLVRTFWGDDIPFAGCFTAEALGNALGRPPCTHVLVMPGPMADGLAAQLQRLSGFARLVPADWVKS